MKDLNKLMEIYSNDIPLLGALQELQQRRELVDIQSAKKFLGNSFCQQFEHMKSELIEIDVAIWGVTDDERTEEYIAMEIIDLQSSCQTMLEGALGLSKDKIMFYRRKVIEKNAKRGYYEPQQSSK